MKVIQSPSKKIQKDREKILYFTYTYVINSVILILWFYDVNTSSTLPQHTKVKTG